MGMKFHKRREWSKRYIPQLDISIRNIDSAVVMDTGNKETALTVCGLNKKTHVGCIKLVLAPFDREFHAESENVIR